MSRISIPRGAFASALCPCPIPTNTGLAASAATAGIGTPHCAPGCCARKFRRQALIGSPANGVRKLALTLPRLRTPSDAATFLTVDLRSEVISGPSDRNARIIAFSDPSGDIGILGCGLTAPKPPQPDGASKSPE